ncbi:class I SAM-dependent methyltransferase [Polymorphobacter sp.]|uniref:class I SAM-dependent methyltransferase n=1 Tax=Polymorphobacter sp. TaxID=1909290 RepID=UPI003F6FFF72
MKTLAALLAPALILAAAPIAAQATTLAEAATGKHRSAANIARNAHRHPVETLTFFDIKPTMTVVEISPSAGWYTEVLAPYLKDQGKLYAAGADPQGNDYNKKAVENFKAFLATHPDLYGKVEPTVFAKGNTDGLAPAGTVDAVLTFRNIHNWYMADWAQDAFNAFFKALKPGGTLGIVEHRLPESADDARMKSSGYMKPSAVRAMAEKAGFKYVASSEINANPKDTKDYPKGVWTLPPNYAEKDVDRAKYTAIGESDRFTMKFVKP